MVATQEKSNEVQGARRWSAGGDESLPRSSNVTTAGQSKRSTQPLVVLDSRILWQWNLFFF